MSAREQLRVVLEDAARALHPGELTGSARVRYMETWMRYSALLNRVESEAVEAYRIQVTGSRIYFAERSGLIKIGTSTQVAARLANIARGASMPPGMEPGPVTLLATMPGDREREKTLHRYFRALRVGRSEWFTDHPDLRDWIRENTQ